MIKQKVKMESADDFEMIVKKFSEKFLANRNLPVISIALSKKNPAIIKDDEFSVIQMSQISSAYNYGIKLAEKCKDAYGVVMIIDITFDKTPGEKIPKTALIFVAEDFNGNFKLLVKRYTKVLGEYHWRMDIEFEENNKKEWSPHFNFGRYNIFYELITSLSDGYKEGLQKNERSTNS